MRILSKILSWLISLIVPVVIVLLIVRLVINPWYLEFEYRTPGFPPDPYGFTQQDRLKYGKIAVDYLVNSSGISFLGDLRFPEGQLVPEPSCQYMADCTQMYNDRELEHMLDVKNVVTASMRVMLLGLVSLLIFGGWAWLSKWQDDYLRGLQLGGILVLVLLGLIIASVLVAFNAIFIIFHEIFFKAGTWTFLYSDTLIRLFPERFWQDTFLMVGGLSIAFGLLVYFVTRRIRLNRVYSKIKNPPDN